MPAALGTLYLEFAAGIGIRERREEKVCFAKVPVPSDRRKSQVPKTALPRTRVQVRKIIGTPHYSPHMPCLSGPADRGASLRIS